MKDFSILMSIYKNENPEWLKESLSSLIMGSQTRPSQIVCVLDGPVTDELEEVVSSFVNETEVLIDLVRITKNVGLGRALREGLKHCKHNIVARIDADDIVEPSRFTKQLGFLDENPKIDIVGSMAIDIDSYGSIIGLRRVPEKNSQIRRLIWACPIIHPSIMFRKSKVLEAGSYSDKLRRRQDYELWFRCVQNGCKFYNIQEPLIKYRVTENSHKKNNLFVAWEQYRIGRKGVKMLGLGWKAKLGVCYPVVKALMPLTARRVLMKLTRRFDPRVNSNE